MRRFLVTGAAGELGHRTIAALRRRCPTARIDAFDRVSAAHPGADNMIGDAKEVDFARLIADRGYAAVVHLAAVSGLKAEADPLETRRINVDASRRLLDACARAENVRFVFASSIAAIGAGAGRGTAGDDAPLQPASTYGRTKKEVEEAVRAAGRGGADAIALRLPTLMIRGRPRQGPPTAGFMSDVARALLNGERARSPMPPGFAVAVASLTEAADALASIAARPERAQAPSVLNLPAFALTPACLTSAVSDACPGAVTLYAGAPDPQILGLAGAWPTRLVTRRPDILGDRWRERDEDDATTRLERLIRDELRDRRPVGLGR